MALALFFVFSVAIVLVVFGLRLLGDSSGHLSGRKRSVLLGVSVVLLVPSIASGLVFGIPGILVLIERPSGESLTWLAQLSYLFMLGASPLAVAAVLRDRFTVASVSFLVVAMSWLMLGWLRGFLEWMIVLGLCAVAAAVLSLSFRRLVSPMSH